MSTEVRRRPGGRSARVRAAVLGATIEVLAESGASGLSVGEVAVRAGVHETSIYRRWGTRQQLILDALVDRSANTLRIPDTGSIREDLIELGQALVDYGTSPLGRALSRTMAASEDDEESAATRREFWDERNREVGVLVERAKARGELPSAVQGRRLVEVFIAPIHFRLLLTRESIHHEYLVELADIAIAGISAQKSQPATAQRAPRKRAAPRKA